MTFDPDERMVLAKLADVLVPAGEGFPSACDAGVAREGLDQVVSFRPDLGPGLKRIIEIARGRTCTAAEIVAELKSREPSLFGVLTDFVPGAYFLNECVRARLRYEGQAARPLDERPDYLEDRLLQSVIDRGPIYRPTPGEKAGSKSKPLPRYDRNRTYDWNYEHAPAPGLVPQEEAAVPGQWDFCGIPIGSPLGIAAGPLLNGRWILFYAALGFDVLTYKTVRSRARACYPLPNLQPVKPADLRDDTSLLEASGTMEGSWAVSFGMPSRGPEVWRADVEATRRALPRHKLLSVSVVATPEPGWTIEELADDFATCARWAVESGADCLEANFSCPNVASADGQLYQQPNAAGRVAATVRRAIRSTPLLIKVGHVTDEVSATELAKALAPCADALVMVNCISARVVDGQQRPLFDGQRRGIAGLAIRDAALEQVRLFSRVIRENGLRLRLVGVGGIAAAEDVRAHFEAGSCAVQLATAAMLDPCLGLRIRSDLAGGIRRQAG
jgi:dihydroorotate dehydrogenase